MRVALFSDIHGNSVGLHAILTHLAQQGGADYYYVLGDILAPGPGAEDIIEALDQIDAQLLRGNWDELFGDPDSHIARLPPSFQEVSWRYYRWICEHLSAASLQRLATLPMYRELVLPSGATLYMCHAAPQDTSSPTCTAHVAPQLLRTTYGTLDASIIAYGHYHAHHTIQLDEKLLLNVASVGMTKRKPSAYTLLTLTDESVVVQQFQVPYDRAEYDRLLHVCHVPLLIANHD